MKINFSGISKGTIIRMIAVLLVILNRVLGYLGLDMIPINERSIDIFVTLGLEAVAVIAAFWKNNSFTIQAQTADEIMAKLKTGVTNEIVTCIKDQIGGLK